jgi:hypothetical protein
LSGRRVMGFINEYVPTYRFQEGLFVIIDELKNWIKIDERRGELQLWRGGDPGSSEFLQVYAFWRSSK